MPKFKGNRYVPVLAWKRGEQNALHSIPNAAREHFTPLLEIVEVAVDLETGEKTKSLEEHVAPAVAKIATAWGAREFFLDPADVANDVCANGTNGAEAVYREANENELHFIPVIGRARSAAELAAARQHRDRGACLRLTTTDLGQVLLPLLVSSFLQSQQLHEQDVDLVIDLGAVANMQTFVFTSTALAALQRIPNIAAWRTLTLLGSAFPSNLGGIQGTQLIDRVEWQGWHELYANRTGLARLPSFGDYAIQSPEVLEGYDPRYMPMSPAIRYTLETQWLIIRGQSSKRVRMATQFPTLASQLVGSPSFYGAGHCPGCEEASQCASGSGGLGSPEAWRRIGTCHHLVKASSQIAALAFP
jgi:hypothetical protein